MNIKVNIHWDEEAEVWVAVCDTLGIVLESGSYDALIEKYLPSPLNIINHTENRNIIRLNDYIQ